MIFIPNPHFREKGSVGRKKNGEPLVILEFLQCRIYWYHEWKYKLALSLESCFAITIKIKCIQPFDLTVSFLVIYLRNIVTRCTKIYVQKYSSWHFAS